MLKLDQEILNLVPEDQIDIRFTLEFLPFKCIDAEVNNYRNYSLS
jgi:hypothetical protein